MMGPGFTQGMAESLFWLMVFIFIAGAVLAAVLIFGVPWLWDMLKPWLHQVTA